GSVTAGESRDWGFGIGDSARRIGKGARLPARQRRPQRCFQSRISNPGSYSLPADEVRSLADGLLIDALAGAPILREATFADVAFGAALGWPGDGLGRADAAVDRRAAFGTAFQRRIGEALQDFDAVSACIAGRGGSDVLVDGHGVE